MSDAASVWLLSMAMRKKAVTYSMMTISEDHRENSRLLMKKMMMMKFLLSSAEKIDYFHQLLIMNGMLDELIKSESVSHINTVSSITLIKT